MIPIETYVVVAILFIALLFPYQSRLFVVVLWACVLWLLWGTTWFYLGAGGQGYSDTKFGLFAWYSVRGGKIYGESVSISRLLLTVVASAGWSALCKWSIGQWGSAPRKTPER